MSDCRLCGNPIQPHEATVLLVADPPCAHELCVTMSGYTPDDLARSTPCCSARELILSFAGAVVERRRGIPTGDGDTPAQVWVIDQDRRVHRYVLPENGPVVAYELQDPTPEEVAVYRRHIEAQRARVPEAPLPWEKAGE